jgi:tripeptidyl-peptidase-1
MPAPLDDGAVHGFPFFPLGGPRLCLSTILFIIILVFLHHASLLVSQSTNRMHLLVLLSTLPLLVGYLTEATALHVPRAGYVVHEMRVEDPSWTRTRRLEGDITLPLRIGLKQRNLDLLPDYLMSVSDPSSPSYGQHWTLKKVVETFTPEPEARDRVHAWLVGSGFEETRVKRSVNQAWIEVRDATASEVEQLLDARYHVYKRESEEHVGEYILAHFVTRC